MERMMDGSETVNCHTETPLHTQTHNEESPLPYCCHKNSRNRQAFPQTTRGGFGQRSSRETGRNVDRLDGQ